jgi:hypothetical protein
MGYVGVAGAVLPGSALSLSVDAAPSVFSPEYDGSATPDSYTLTITNVGSVAAAGALRIVDALPAGVTVTGMTASEIEEESASFPCDMETVTCVYDEKDEKPLLPGDSLRVNITVSVEPGLLGKEVVDAATVSEDGAPPVSAAQSTSVGTAAQSAGEPFGFARLATEALGVDGLPDTQAGDHPFQFLSSFALNTAYGSESGFKLGGEPAPAGGREGTESELKDVVVEIPPGLVGDPQAVPKCPQYKVFEVVNPLLYACPPESQVGEATVYLSPTAVTGPRRGSHAQNDSPVQISPIFNVQPDKGYPAEFAFQAVNVIVSAYATVNEESNYGVRVTVKNIPAASGAVGGSFLFFGTPATNPNLNNVPRSSASPVAFLDNPTDCSAEPQYTKIYADTWENPGTWKTPGHEPEVSTHEVNSTSVPLLSGPGSAGWVETRTLSYPSITGCNMLQFDPEIEVVPSTTQADEPTGLTVHLKVPQANQEAPLLSTPPLKDATVTLPAGLSVNPSAADGLQGCSEAQIELSSPVAGHCPNASELGTVRVKTPLLPASEPLEGDVFLASPRCDPCSDADAADGNMVRLYLQVEGAGVVVKKEGTVYVDTATGQLTTTFQDNPQVPFSELELQFKSGLRAALATPQSCGTFSATSDLTPWSAPVTPDASSTSPFEVSWDGNGGACPASAPFAPAFSAGTSNPNAGQFSPLTVTLAREDREQDIRGVQVTTPPGLSGILTGIPLCGEPQASLGTCPEASRIGTMTVAAGAGPHPFYEKGSLYLTGPYGGAPFGLSIVVPTVAGPFNLGNVVVRAMVNIDHRTAALTVTSDPLPQIIDGVPLRLRTANVTVEREHFVFNPTSCAAMHIKATITGAQGAVSHSEVPFAVAGCAGLSFKPSFKASTSSHTSRGNGASLYVQLTVPPGTQSNIAKAKVELPKQLPSRLTTLQKACTAATFESNPASCPTGSLVGYAKVITPLLPVTLSGPAYFVSYGNAKFPELIVVLQGYGVRVDLHGETFISKTGITSSTFNEAPDVPFTSFELYLPEGKDSALAANGNLCAEKQKLGMPTTFTAQDGTELKQTTKIAVTGCPKTTASTKSKNKRKTKR